MAKVVAPTPKDHPINRPISTGGLPPAPKPKAKPKSKTKLKSRKRPTQRKAV